MAVMTKSWKSATLEEISLNITDGSHNPPKGVESSDYPMLSSRNIFDDEINLDKIRFLNKEAYEKEHKRTNISAGDVLLTIVGTIGRVAIAEEKHLPFTLQRSVAVIKPDTSIVCSRYLMYCLMSMSNDLNSRSRGAAQKGIYLKQLRAFVIEYPDLEEQQRIVSILDEAFENISNSSKRVEQKLIDAKELFSSLVEEKYTDKEGKWNQKTISELCKIGDGNHSSKYPKKSEMVETGIPFIRGTNLVNGRISDDDMRYITEQKHSTLKKGHLLTGDVLFTNRGEIGKVAIVDERFNNANLNSQLAWFRCGEEITSKFLFYFLQKGEMKRHFSQSKTGAALQQFTIKMIKSVSISYPSIEEQKEIVESCQLMQKRVEEITQIYLKESDSIVELKQSILQEVFNGTLRIAEGLAGQS